MSGLTDAANTPNGPPANNTTGSLETVPNAVAVDDDIFPPNTPLAASTTSFLLGSVVSLGLWLVLNNSHLITVILQPALWRDVAFNLPGVQLPFFFAAWAFFHWAEFAVTAGWNRDKCSTSSFLLDNGREYHIAHSVAVLEFVLTVYFFPNAKRWNYVTPIGMLVVLGGQFLRSIAMIHASKNFSHMVAYKRLHGHELVTDGIYSWSRHPSYVGFFYWGLGTQIALQNPISFIGYFIVMLRFFQKRIFYEEKALIRFFGTAYQEYKAKVPTRIPLIR
ncbi:hypothetical protein M408DRAFT_8173 [Serendipita vermifera MAFF 305830]|uniref:Protein-S-isoprenylcysteine O-methyltransferase n=1 Tax=Serendipita vermifera MAFF 305830 TaxID=933852 RepID=A0A0C3AYB0_SERVB|nr:hypothetical protein M408DRAFT_8173 [Serendipita vermifera MAFF 305830]